MENSIALLTGSILSLAFSFLPGLKTWYNGFDPKKKQIIMIAVLAIVSVLVGALNCANVAVDFLPVFGCDAAGIGKLVEVFILAATGSVTTHQSTNYIK